MERIADIFPTAIRYLLPYYKPAALLSV